MLTELVPVTKLEFVPVPDSLSKPCVSPAPPEELGKLTGQALVDALTVYNLTVLGVLDLCNEQLFEVRKLMAPPNEKQH